MGQQKTELVSDPLFQLNAVLWLSQPLPISADISPLLHEKGFRVYAVGQQMTLPPRILQKIGNTDVAINDSALPDVIVAREESGAFALVECKGNSFSPPSTTAAQARTLMIAADGPAAEILGLDQSQVSRVVLEYLMPEEKRPEQTNTNRALISELKQRGLSSGEVQILGLQMTATFLELVVVENNNIFGLGTGVHAFMIIEPETDPRPLYFVPYDPTIDQSQTERDLSKRILLERLHAGIVSYVGRAICPANLTFLADSLLNDAMFGMYAQWEDHESNRHLKRILKQLMDAIGKALNDEIPDVFRSFQQGQWTIALTNEPLKEKVLAVLTSFSCETLGRVKEPEPDLFDKLN